MIGGGPAPSLAQDSAGLGHQVRLLQQELERALQLSDFKNDPMLPLIRFMSTSLGLQWQLHDQAVRLQRSVSDRMDMEVADTILKGETELETRKVAIVEKLAPELARLTASSVKTWNRSVTLKTALGFGGFALALGLGIGAAGYGMGWAARDAAAAHTLSVLNDAVRRSGSGTENALVAMVSANNLPEAWAKCLKTATVDTKSGRKVCAMPLWAEPETSPGRT